MTEQQLRNLIVHTAQKYVGARQGEPLHRSLVDLYNNSPPARGKVSYTSPWCAIAVSAWGIEAGLGDIVFKEASCGRMITLYQQAGRWQEKDSHRPLPGDIIMYDWDDTGVGDNTGAPEHVGLVEDVVGSTITVIEGNMSKAVGRRNIQVNGRYIRGFCLPNYAGKASGTSRFTLGRGDVSGDVRYMQTRLIAHGFPCGPSGADGSFGPATEAALKDFQRAKSLTVDGICGAATWAALEAPPSGTSSIPAVLKRGDTGAAVKLMQEALIRAGFPCGPTGADSSFGPSTEAAVKHFQRARGLAVDGYCGPITQRALGLVK